MAPTSAGGGGAGLYNALPTPARICDTRAGNPSGLSGGDAQCNGGASNPGERIGSAGGTISVQVTGNAGIPVGATAAVLNVTSVAPSAAGYLTVYPQGATQPFAANVNYAAGQTGGNRVIVPLSVSGQVSIYSLAASDVVVDVSGYFSASGGSGTQFSFSASGGSGTQFSAEAAPIRICDTRPGNPSGLSGGEAQCNGTGDVGDHIGPAKILTIQVTGLAGVPSTAKAVVVNLTAVAPTAATYLTVFPAAPVPLVADLNPTAGEVRGNLTVATLSSTGTISIYNDTGTINVVVDVLGWYSD